MNKIAQTSKGQHEDMNPSHLDSESDVAATVLLRPILILPVILFDHLQSKQCKKQQHIHNPPLKKVSLVKLGLRPASLYNMIALYA